MSSLTQLRTKHMRPAGSLYRRLLSEQRSLRDESAQLHTSDQEGTVTAGALRHAAKEDDIYLTTASKTIKLRSCRSR